MKSFSIISGIASILSLIAAIYPGLLKDFVVPFLDDNNALLVLIALAFAILAWLFFVLSKYRSEVIPKLFGLKGACASTNELVGMVRHLDEKSYTQATRSLIGAVIASNIKRIRDISEYESPLREVADELENIHIMNIDLASLERSLIAAHNKVQGFERMLLRQEKLEDIVYR